MPIFAGEKAICPRHLLSTKHSGYSRARHVSDVLFYNGGLAEALQSDSEPCPTATTAAPMV